MNFRNISAWSIRNPVVPIVLFVGLMLAGLLAFARMQVQDSPDIEAPFVLISITQPGAAPSEIETQVTQRIEGAVRTITGIEHMTSAASEGSSMTFIEFDLGVDINAKLNEVKNAIDQARGSLPDGILEPQITKLEISSGPLAYFAVSADNMTIEQLSWFVDDTVAKRLLSVTGMAEIQRSGGVSREIAVTLDPARMQSYGITASQINLTLRAQNTNAAGGKAEIGGSRQSVRVLGNAKDAYALSQTDISLGGGRFVKLADIASVTDSVGEITSIAKLRGKSVVTFAMTRARGASDVSVYDEAVVEIAKLEKEHPGIHFRQLYTTVDHTKLQYESSMSSMVEGAILAVIVVFFFLRDWRATAISAIAIPLSAIPAFWFMSTWFGFSLNQMSMLALGLVAGVLVDDAIVEIENIVRHMRMGKTAFQASIDAADEIGLAVVATTFSIVAVFLPVGLMPGIPGQYFKNFGLTVVVAVLMSLAVARMITPMIAAYFLKAHGEAEHGGGAWMDRYLQVLHWSLDTALAKQLRARLEFVKADAWFWIVGTLAVIVMVAGFVGPVVGLTKHARGADWPMPLAIAVAVVAGAVCAVAVNRLLAWLARLIGGRFGAWYAFMGARFRARLRDHRVWMLGIGIAALVLTGVLIMSIPMQFNPAENSDSGQLKIEMVPGTTIAQTEAVADRAAAILYGRSDVTMALESIHEGAANIYTSYAADRKATSQEIEADLNAKLQQIPDARISFIDVNQQGPSNGPTRPVVVMLTGEDGALLERTASDLAEQMRGLPQLVAPRVEADLRRPEVVITPRLDLASSLGVSTSALSQAVRIATLGDIDQNAAKFSLTDRQVPIRVKLSESSRRDLSTLRNMPVPTVSGGSVPLGAVADIGFGSGLVSIQRYNQQRRVYVSADLARGVYLGDATEKLNALPLLKHLPNGVAHEPVTQEKFLNELLVNFAVALVSAVLLVFAVLVLLYHRVISPLVNMSSLFLAPLGGLIALGLLGQPISLPVFIGVLMLFGIVAKNSILLIDFAIEEMASGTDKFAAIVEAGHKRAQPIIMTTVAMTAGMIPTALSLSGDGAWRAPMGTVVIGGLILSTLLTLLIVPAGFSLADGFERRLGPRLRKLLLSYEPEHALEANHGAAPGGALPAE